MSKKNGDRKNVVVVGGGAGGATTARALSGKLDTSKYNLILIDSRPYSTLLPATPRMVVSDIDNIQENAFVPFDKLFINGNGTFIHGRVTAIRKSARGGYVFLESGEQVLFEVLVLAPGSLWDGPLAFPDDKAQAAEFIKKGRDSIKNANDIVLVGGGAVGIELAGEIMDVYPDKKVTLVQGGDLVLNKTYPKKFRQGLQGRLVARRVNVVLNDYVDEVPVSGGDVITRKGKTIRADLVLSTKGPRPNTDFIASSLGVETLTTRGLVKIKPTLQLLGHSEIFVVGDVLDFDEQKQYAKAGNHAALVSSNVLSYLAGRPLKDYKGSLELISVTVGKSGGASYFGILWGLVFGDWFTKLVKAKGLMLDQMRPGLGY